MTRGILVGIVVVLFLAGMGALAYSLFSSVRILPRLDNATMNMGELPGKAQTLFRIGRVYYHSTTVMDNATNTTMDICDTSRSTQIVIVELLYNASKAPEKCEAYVDNLFQKKVTPQPVPCGNSCDTEELKLAIDIREQDIYKTHELQLCCDELCVQKPIQALCR